MDSQNSSCLENALYTALSPNLLSIITRNETTKVKGNVLLFPSSNEQQANGMPRIQCIDRLGGLLKYYHSRAA